jgi:hypothetical protein
MDKSTVETMLQSGHASVAHLAHHFKVSIQETEGFLRDNNLVVPTAQDPQYHYLNKFQAASRPNPVDWESLVFDDPDHRWINGIDTLTTPGIDPRRPDGGIDRVAIVTHYHGLELRCQYTGEPTDAVMQIDGSPNFLITNLVAISKDTIKQRFSMAPLFVVSKEYRFKGPERIPSDPIGSIHRDDIKVSIQLLLRLDQTYGAAFKEPYVDAVVDQWLRPYFEHFDHRDILAPALLKGLAKVEVEINGIIGAVTKDSYLQMVVGLIQRAAESRVIASRPSSILTVQQVAPGRSPGQNPGLIIP